MPVESVMHTARDFFGTIALIALLSVAYGTTIRWCDNQRLARLILGASFGGAAVLAMLDPMVVAPGVIVDLRSIPLALAGAYLGVEGLLVAASMTIGVRLGLGGDGALAGSVSLLLAGLLGMVWHHRHGSAPRGPRAIMVLAALLPVHWVSILLLPHSMVQPFAIDILPCLATVEMVALVIVAALIERERTHDEGERRLALDADRDPLTGLLNRRGFEREVSRRRGGQAGALLLLDLDHFKRVNDRHGHIGGDAVLRELGARLASVLQPGQVIARLGGEELAVFLPGQTAQAVREMARRLAAAVRCSPFHLPDGGDVLVTASVGGAWGDRPTLDALMAQADAALYAAKHAGRDRCHFAGEGHAPAAPSRRRTGLPGGHLRGPGATEGGAGSQAHLPQVLST